MGRLSRLVLLVLLGLPVAATAAPRLISTSGVFSAATPVSLWSKPNQPWTLSFVIDEQPAVTSSSPNFFFRPAMSSIRYTGLLYTLNGHFIPLPDGFIYVYRAPIGPFGVCFNAGCTRGFQIEGPQQVYTGPESAPTMLTGTFPESRLLFVLPGSGTYVQTPGVVTISEGAFGAVTRALSSDEFNSTDNIGGSVGHLYSKRFASPGGTQAAYAAISNELSVGAWSLGTDGAGAARAIAFRSYRNTTNQVVQVRANAILDGHFEAAPWNLPNGTLWVGGMIHILDGAGFSERLAASASPPEEFLIGGYGSIEATRTTAAFDVLTARLGSVTLASDSVIVINGRIGEHILPLATGLVAIQPGQVFTVLFDITTVAIAERFGGRIGAGSVAFLDTLTAAPDFFTGADGLPVAGIESIGAAPTLPPEAASLTLTQTATGPDVSGTLSQPLTATVVDATGAPVAEELVRFEVTSGPNVGLVGGAQTDANGRASFAYVGQGGAGTDTITARVGTHVSNSQERAWTVVTPRLTATVVGTGAGPVTGTGGTVYVDVSITNISAGPILALALTGVNTRALTGAGAVGYATGPGLSPALPTSLGPLAAGQSITVRLYLSVADAVRRLRVEELLSVVGGGGELYQFSLAQNVIR